MAMSPSSRVRTGKQHDQDENDCGDESELVAPQHGEERRTALCEIIGGFGERHVRHLRLLVTNSRIEQAIGDVDQDVHDEDDQGRDHDGGQDTLKSRCRMGVDHQLANAGEAEDRLDDDCAFSMAPPGRR